MRRSYIDRPRRLPTPRGVARRSRLAPVLLALPLVTALWLTIGLPVFAELSGTSGGGGTMRDFFFDADATGGARGGGGQRPRGSEPETIAAAVVDPRVVREVRIERLREQTIVYVTRRTRKPKPGARTVVSQLVDHTPGPGERTTPLNAVPAPAPVHSSPPSDSP